MKTLDLGHIETAPKAIIELTKLCGIFQYPAIIKDICGHSKGRTFSPNAW